MRRFLLVWGITTAIGCALIASHARLEKPVVPALAWQRWALDTIEAAQRGEPSPAVPSGYATPRAPEAMIVLAWRAGRVRARSVQHGGFVDAVRSAADTLARDAELRALVRRTQADARFEPVRFTVTLAGESAAWLSHVPFLSELSVVPLVEGVRVELPNERVDLTPDELTAHGLWDRAVITSIPDLAFGLSREQVARVTAERLDASTERVLAEARFSRFTAHTFARDSYPREQRVDLPTLELAARRGAEMLLRHQRPEGRFTYRYDAATGRAVRRAGYSLPRHGGTTYFLAQAARVLAMPEAREGARRALAWVQQDALRQCGGDDRACVTQGERADVGSSALTALAAAELLRSGDDPEVRALLERLTTFLRSMQRADGELMHLYDVPRQQPIDVQKMYFSGEAAYALLASHRALGDASDLATVRPLMKHLTGAAWSFFGSRYFYGEEHWTCQAVAQAAPHMEIAGALDFCLRWLEFQRALIYRSAQTPWPVAGALGAGPVVIPRLTAVASRVEAGAQIYALARKRGLPVAALRAQIEAHLGFLLRMSWNPGPTHLFRVPAAALGGVPATQASLEVRNDFVQHAGSGMLLWVEILRAEQAPSAAASHAP